MNIRYRILNVNDSERGITVRYFTDEITEMDLATSYDENGIATVNGYPISCRTDYNFTVYNLNATEEDINTMIRNGAPIDWFRLLEAVKNPDINTDINTIAPPISSTNVAITVE